MSFIRKIRPVLIAALLLLLLGAVTVATMLFAAEAPTVTYYETESDYLSPGDVAVAGNYAYVADQTGDRVIKVNLTNGSVAKTVTLDAQVNGIYADGSNVYVLAGGLAGEVITLNQDLAVQRRVDAGHTPVAAVSDSTRLYVLNRFSGDLYIYSKTSGALQNTVVVGREPMAAVLNGGKLFIACHLPEGAANADSTSASIAVVDAAGAKLEKKIALVNGSNSVKDLALSTNGKYLYAVSVISRYTYPTTQLQDGWVNTNGINVIDLSSQSLVTAVLLDDADYGAANPNGIAVKDNKIVVSLAGHDQIAVVNESEMLSRLEKITAKKDAKAIAEIADDLTFLSGAKQRIDLQGMGPRAVTLYNNEVLITDYFSAQLERYPLAGGATTAITLGSSAKPDAARVGEIIWNDASLCYGGWESCATCHPDGRSDGFNWDEPGDGLGTPKNTKSMIMSHRTPPCLATGIEGDTENNVRGSLGGGVYINGSLTEEQIAAVDTYLKSLTPVQSPYLNRDGSLTENAKKGAALFEKNCAACHTGPYYTDMQYHLSPTLELDDSPEDRPFNSPTLVELWRSAPYFFNGCYTTMEEVVNYYNGVYKLNLSATEVKQLSEFILSIGTVDEYYGVVMPLFEGADGETSRVIPVSNGKLSEITVCKQIETSKDAILTFTLYKKDGSKVLTSKAVTISGETKVGDIAKISFDLDLPEITAGMYYTIDLKDSSGSALATTYVYTYTE